MDRIGIIIQARMGSTRMPGKVLKPFVGEISILELIIETCKRNDFSLPVIVATTLNEEDDAVERKAIELGVYVFRGDEKNVLKRFVDAAAKYNLDKVIRVCADNPLLDLELLNEVIAASSSSTADYISFRVDENTPAILSHWGIFVEMVSVKAMKKTLQETNEALYLEHVTNYIYRNPEKFSLTWLKAPEGIYGNMGIRFTVDSPMDFTMMQQFYTHLAASANSINFKDALLLLQKHPEFEKTMLERIKANTK